MDMGFHVRVLVCGLALASAGLAAGCPDGFFEAAGGCFVVHTQPSTGQTDLDWGGARSLCQGLSNSTWSVDLAVFDSSEQLAAVSEAWSSISLTYPYAYPYMWIGVTRQEDAWAWLDGRPLSRFSNMWRVDYPAEAEDTGVYLEDYGLSNGANVFGRLYVGNSGHQWLRRCMCRAKSS
ncbi:uncharacterized protein LOC122250599 [Penaeus japonicus]|uniref:uncharacterized protein LOC122250599 n=1 Tax=Penaeus japonicus TaxID=27405 RepID=UPI001C70C781|nr:uncharacterized protein LOC122250599 [Penaeus japonicus]